jgi:hypothetical protein
MISAALPETISALAAFFSGIGTVLTGWFAIRYERKRSKEECDERFKAFHAGIQLNKEYFKEGET